MKAFRAARGMWKFERPQNKWRFPEMAVPQNGWVIRENHENPVKIYDLGVPLVWETPVWSILICSWSLLRPVFFPWKSGLGFSLDSWLHMAESHSDNNDPDTRYTKDRKIGWNWHVANPSDLLLILCASWSSWCSQDGSSVPRCAPLLQRPKRITRQGSKRVRSSLLDTRNGHVGGANSIK